MAELTDFSNFDILVDRCNWMICDHRHKSRRGHSRNYDTRTINDDRGLDAELHSDICILDHLLLLLCSVQCHNLMRILDTAV